ncbi:MAG: hypothetical protein P1V51_06865 [Deltaproteobacteria bacterium]|nr:hypothetical protein [Deltaproteobacteria bacterium]
MLLTAAGALSAPPSTVLKGPLGKLEWKVKTTESGLVIDGTSPKWTVHHEAKADFTPILTKRSNPEGRKVEIRYDAKGADFTVNGEKSRIKQKGLWDSESVDIRLGAITAAGQTEVEFPAIDTDSGKVYTFGAEVKEKTSCQGVPCTHVELHLTGFYKLVGPSWDYWFDAEGKLLRFEAKWGKFKAAPAAKKEEAE